MPTNPKSPDPFFSPESSREAQPATSGEFTQVFASIAPPPTPSAPDAKALAFAPADDEFTRLFSVEPNAAAPLAAPPSAPAVAQPLAFAPSDDDFTRIFSTIPSTTPAAAPPSPSSMANEATLIFEQVHVPPANPQSPTPVPPAPQAIAQPVTAVPPAPLRASEQPASEFTQIFTSVAPPPPLPLEAKPVPAPASSSGEFTQFFSAISAREASSAKPAAQGPAMPPSGPVYPPVVPAPAPPVAQPAESAGGFTQLFQQAQPPQPAPAQQTSAPVAQQPAASLSQQPPPAAEPGSFTQMFQQIQPPVQQPAPRAVVSPAPAPPSVPAADAGSFTQMFQQIQPPPSAAPLPAAVPSAAAAPAQSAAPQRPAFQQPADAWPAFGPPAQPQGTFTDVFAARPEPRLPQPEPRLQQPAPAAPPQWPASQPAAQDGGGFTQLFQTPPAAPQAHRSSSFGSPVADSSWPQSQSPSLSQNAAPPVAGGEFTRLMNSLASPGSASSSALNPGQASPSLPMQHDAFFGTPSAGGGSAERSEFTRVLRGSAQRESSAVAAPPAAGPAAPGLAPAPAKKEDAGDKAPAKKSKTLVILLVVMNVILVLALILIGILVMRHK